ncbi:MAG: hypothetical protein RL174_522, partial [Actinomycetota bacterium]
MDPQLELRVFYFQYMEYLTNLYRRFQTGAIKLNRKLVLLLLAISALAAFLINGSISNTASGSISSEAYQNSATEISDSNQLSGQSSEIAAQSTIDSLTVYVHVVGEVEHPGIYALESGSRLVEAIAQAGGFTRKADQSSVNLARMLTDGEQIFVLKPGSSSVGAASQLGPGSSFGATSPERLVSLNRGSQAELEELPGVGPTLAQRIIDWRTANGGFKNKVDLQSVA